MPLGAWIYMSKFYFSFLYYVKAKVLLQVDRHSLVAFNVQ